jgi:hypothetical protein
MHTLQHCYDTRRSHFLLLLPLPLRVDTRPTRVILSSVRRRGSVVEQRFRKPQVVGSNPTAGCSCRSSVHLSCRHHAIRKAGRSKLTRRQSGHQEDRRG